MSSNQPSKKNRFKALNIAFALICIAVLLFLLLAPEETTTPLPVDEIHLPFHRIADKKEAEATCQQCHAPTGEAPLSEDHPPPYRCLFCHKRDA
jgi:hypothetical protein